jgi:hypothetical protein
MRLHALFTICGLSFVSFVLLPGPTHGCGVLVHNEVFRRARQKFALPSTSDSSERASLRELYSSYLSDPENEPSVQAGSFFPDWGYGCFNTDEQSEAAHWPPFINAGLDHSKYFGGCSAFCYKILSFIFPIEC